MRYRSTVTGKEDGQVGSFEYVWVDGKLISIVFVSDGSTSTAKYLYNDFDEPVGMIVTDADGTLSTYYYLKNAQGDITNIVNASGVKMIEFTYDVFGNQTVYYQSDPSTIAGMLDLVEQVMVHSLTPFSYRGYCYDVYSGLYYLQSRYYDPQTGRFINADDTNYLNATGTVLGCNLFAYCENDPVNYVDPKGTAYSVLSTYYYLYPNTYFITTKINYLIGNVVSKSLSTFYFLENGIVEIINSVPDLQRIINSKWSYYQAKGIYNAAKTINSKNLKGRTVKGIQLEILVHYYCYKLVIKLSSTKVSNIGGTDIDKNARIFEMGKFLNYLSFLAVASNPVATFAVVMLFISYLQGEMIMKKTFKCIVILLLLFSLVGCSKEISQTDFLEFSAKCRAQEYYQTCDKITSDVKSRFYYNHDNGILFETYTMLEKCECDIDTFKFIKNGKETLNK